MERESSWHHATKVMVLGVIAAPDKDHGFDGKVYFTQVSRNKKYTKATYNNNILDDLAEKAALHCQWKDFIADDQEAEEMIAALGIIFDINKDIEESLVI